MTANQNDRDDGIGLQRESDGVMDFDKNSYQAKGSDVESLSSSKKNGAAGDTTQASGVADDTTATSLSSLGRRDTVQIIRLRRLVFALMTVFMLLIGYASYYILNQWQISHLDDAFHDVASKIIDSFHWKLQRKLHVLSSLSTSISSYANLKKKRITFRGDDGVLDSQVSSAWPMVTIPDFHILASSSRNIAHAVSVSFCPLVTDETRPNWEYYSVNHADQWIENGYEFEQRHHSAEAARGRHLLGTTDNTVSPRITVLDEDNAALITAPPASSNNNSNKTYFFPLWQSSPIVPELVNYDMSSNENFNEGIQAMVASHQAVLGKVTDIDDGSQSHVVMDQFEQHWQQQQQGGTTIDYGRDPVSKLYFPVFEDLLEATSSNGSKNLVGMVVAVLFWEIYMNNVLPHGTPPMMVRLHNECDEEGVSYSYQIIGQDVTYMGRSGTHHDDIKFRMMETKVITTDLSLLTHRSTVDTKDHFEGVATLNHDFCPYKISIYPTEEFVDEFITNLPFYFAAIIVGIFLFTMFMIRCYDWQVDKRQEMVMEQVLKSNAIVASIFPAEVRDRLFKDDKKGGQSKVSFNTDFQKAKIKNFLYGDNQTGNNDDGPAEEHGVEANRKSNIIGATGAAADLISSDAIAYEFEATTILFADIVGFAAWSSQREPTQIFMLLQTLYHSFDTIASKSKVYKVETVGDCYMAATGLPKPQPDHHIRMARFARAIMESMTDITRKLDIILGPDTGELKMRVGIHSGPVAGGVLMGAKTRFQLFGDTVNTASRMESSGLANRIHCSEKTATLLVDSGKEHWVKRRDETVHLKGKGSVATFWVMPRTPTLASKDNKTAAGPTGVNFVDDCSDVESDTMMLNSDYGGGSQSGMSDLSSIGSVNNNAANTYWADMKMVQELAVESSRQQRLVEWNVALLSGYLKQIQAQRLDILKQNNFVNSHKNSAWRFNQNQQQNVNLRLQEGSTALDEVTETIQLPEFDENIHSMANKTRPESIELDELVELELKDYVTTIASMYRSNPFHNFEHASHVTQSTSKLLKRIVLSDETESLANAKVTALELHTYSHGLASDCLSQFALIFCALIHDVDHPGVPNFQLVAEQTNMAKYYKNKSIAEQNSVDLAWDLLMDPMYSNLQKAIYQNEAELRRFRQLVVNMILATDIFDKDMKSIREQRWDKAFHAYDDQCHDDGKKKDDDDVQKESSTRSIASTALNQVINLKATVVIEHLIQSSDVSHCMQHYDIYKKWNERLFHEAYVSYEAGRSKKDPSKGWIEGEVWFFDRYIIPLAKKLSECGVFGVASDEYLNFALENRKQLISEWQRDGDKMVDEFLERYNASKISKAYREGGKTKQKYPSTIATSDFDVIPESSSSSAAPEGQRDGDTVNDDGSITSRE